MPLAQAYLLVLCVRCQIGIPPTGKMLDDMGFSEALWPCRKAYMRELCYTNLFYFLLQGDFVIRKFHTYYFNVSKPRYQTQIETIKNNKIWIKPFTLSSLHQAWLLIKAIFLYSTKGWTQCFRLYSQNFIHLCLLPIDYCSSQTSAEKFLCTADGGKCRNSQLGKL